MISVYLLLDWYMCHIWAKKKVTIRNKRNHPKQAAFSISLILFTFVLKKSYVQFE